MPLFSKRHAGSTWRHRLRGRLFAAGWALSAGCIVWMVTGSVLNGPVLTWAFGMFGLLIAGYITQPPIPPPPPQPLPIPQGGIEQVSCWKCGYDLRASVERCSECGERNYRTEEPIDEPETFLRRGFGWSGRLEAHVYRRLLARTRPALNVWGEDPLRRAVAEFVCESAWEACGWPNPWFLPNDRFKLTLVGDSMGAIDTFFRIERRFDIRLKLKWDRMVTMTVGEFVDYLILEVGGRLPVLESNVPQRAPFNPCGARTDVRGF